MVIRLQRRQERERELIVSQNLLNNMEGRHTIRRIRYKQDNGQEELEWI